MGDNEEVACRVRVVTAPDGVDIPVPAGGIGLSTGMVTIRDDADVSIQVSDNGYCVAVNNAEPSNDEAAELFEHFTVRGSDHGPGTPRDQGLCGSPRSAVQGGPG